MVTIVFEDRTVYAVNQRAAFQIVDENDITIDRREYYCDSTVNDDEYEVWYVNQYLFSR
jgi:hypothetical protein